MSDSEYNQQFQNFLESLKKFGNQQRKLIDLCKFTKDQIKPLESESGLDVKTNIDLIKNSISIIELNIYNIENIENNITTKIDEINKIDEIVPATGAPTFNNILKTIKEYITKNINIDDYLDSSRKNEIKKIRGLIQLPTSIGL